MKDKYPPQKDSKSLNPIEEFRKQMEELESDNDSQFHFLNQDRIALLKNMYEKSWETVDFSEVLSNIANDIYNEIITKPINSQLFNPNISIVFGTVNEDGKDIPVLAVSCSVYTSLTENLANGELDKIVDVFIKELTQAVKIITKKKIIFKNRYVQYDKSHIKTAMQTEMFRKESVFSYSLS